MCNEQTNLLTKTNTRSCIEGQEDERVFGDKLHPLIYEPVGIEF